ncbi:hypothetical protein [Sediminicoccus sp. BL-A-41-H5]|uniref:hypothetical protein n=1 Tax=Sediminicoccus sp. BL-A-41-H5 TaxID=3421106 RepID=UPI003D67DE06
MSRRGRRRGRFVAQSIGGGGGTAQGGSINLGGVFTVDNLPSVTPSGTFTVNLGAKGGAGGGGVAADGSTAPGTAEAYLGPTGSVPAATNRNGGTVTINGTASTITRGSPTLSNLGGLQRATYTLGGEEFYLRPSMTLSLIQARSGAWRESGAGGAEPGGRGRAHFANGVGMRLFTTPGVSLLSSGQWSQESRLVSSPSPARFGTVVRTDQVVGRLAAGAQVFATDRLEVRLQCESEYSAKLTGHGGSVSVALRF